MITIRRLAVAGVVLMAAAIASCGGAGSGGTGGATTNAAPTLAAPALGTNKPAASPMASGDPYSDYGY
jgi:hypothetical protein